MRVHEFQLPGHDRTPLFVRHFQPAHGTEDRTILLVHGMSEHGQRYEHVIESIVERGWNIVVPDQRGHGLSGGVPTHVRRFRQYVDDLETIRQHLELRPERTAIVGHSMGGLVAARYVQRLPGNAAVLVLLSPLLGIRVPIPRSTVALGRMLSWVAPRVRFRSRVNIAHTTRNAVLRNARLSDPLAHRSVTAGWYFAMQAALRAAWRDVDKINLPLLVLQAGQDRIVDAHATQAWVQAATTPDRTIRQIIDGYHELLNEPDWPSTAAHIMSWLEERIHRSVAMSPAPSPPDPKIQVA